MAVIRHPRPWGWLTAALLLVAVVHFSDRSLLRQVQLPVRMSLDGDGQRGGSLWQWEWQLDKKTDGRWVREGHALPDSLETAGRGAEALQAWNVLRHADSSDFRAWKAWGQGALRAGDADEARSTLLWASTLDPSDFGVWQSLGLTWIRLDQPTLATLAFDRAAAVDPADARSRLNGGIAMLRQSKWAAALDRLDAALDRSSGPLSAKVQAYRGQALRGLGRREEAAEAYDAAISLDPDQLLARLGASELMEDAMERLVSLEKLARLHPDRAVVQWAHGQALLEMNRPLEAELALDRAMELAPDEPRFARDLMRLYLDREEVESAQRVLDERFAAEQRSPERWFLQARIASQSGEDEGAVALYDSALAACDGHMAEAWLNRGAALRRLDRFDEALASYRMALAELPEYPEAWFNIGVGLSESGDREGAIEAYRRSLGIDADQPKAWFNIGVLHRRNEDMEQALAAWEEAILLDDRYALAWYNLAINRARLGRPDASDAFEALLERDPDHLKGWTEWSSWLESQGRLAEAVVALRKVLELDPEDGRSWGRLGANLHDLGDEEGALLAFREVVERNPDQSRSRFNLGLQLERMDRDAEAVLQYRRAHQLDPEFMRPIERVGDIGRATRDEGLVYWALDRTLTESEVLEWSPDSVYEFARALHRLDLQQEARSRYAEAMARGKDGVWPVYWSAKAAEELGLLEEARAGYGEVLNVREDFKFALYRLALLEASSDVSKARRLWAALEQAHPEFAAEKVEEKP